MYNFLIKSFLFLTLLTQIGCFKNEKVKTSGRFPAEELGASSDVVTEDVYSGSAATVNGEAYVAPSLPVGSNAEEFSPRCREIITKKGNPGPTGRALLDAMKRVEENKGKSCFYGADGEASKIGKYCNGEEHFNSLTEKQKESLWLWFWASLAQSESSCNMQARYASPAVYESDGSLSANAVVYDGMFLLPYRTVDRPSENTIFCPERVDTATLEFQSNCAVSRFADLHCGADPLRQMDEKRDQNYVRQWMSLRPDAQISRRFRRMIKLHPLCSN